LLVGHRLNVSHIDVREDGAHIVMTIDIDPHDLPLFERIDRDSDGVLTQEEVLAQTTSLDALIAARVQIRGRGGMRCNEPTRMSEFHADVSMWHTVLTTECPRPAQEFAIYFGFLDTLPRGHQAFAKISSDGRVRTETVLGPKHALLDERKVDRARLFFSLVLTGAEHIFTGIDHILFVIALLLSARSVRSVLLRLTAFTLAHSLTLALALTGVVSVSSRIVEPLIALSIAVVALEWKREKPLLAILVAFAFGLLHGLGFASSMEQSAFSDKAFVLSLAGFNVGIELGQMSIVLVVWPLLRRLPERFRLPAKGSLAAVGVIWAAIRAFAG